MWWSVSGAGEQVTVHVLRPAYPPRLVTLDLLSDGPLPQGMEAGADQETPPCPCLRVWPGKQMLEGVGTTVSVLFLPHGPAPHPQLSSLWPLGLVTGVPLADPKELLPAQGEPDRTYRSSSHTLMAK